MLNLFTDALDVIDPEILSSAIVRLALSGIEEGFRLDFKESWNPDSACQHIIAFANAYGGVLVLGISNDRQRFPGIQQLRNSDLKTQIASTIASRIAPVPVFEVHTCPSPENEVNLLAMIRVSPQPRVHMYLKGEKPVYVRSGDRSVPADASQLRVIIDREKNSERGEVNGRNEDPLSEMYVSVEKDLSLPPDADLGPQDRRARKYAEKANPENRCRSTTYLALFATPDRRIGLELDVAVEQRLKALVLKSYPEISERRSLQLGAAVHERDDRRSKWFEYHWLDVEQNHEMLWRFTREGSVWFMTQVAGGFRVDKRPRWSLVDLIVNLAGALKTAHQAWLGYSFYGAAEVSVGLVVTGLSPAVGRSCYHSLFYGDENGPKIPIGAVRSLSGLYEVGGGHARIMTAFTDREERLEETLAALGNDLLRDLRFGVDRKVLRNCIAAWLGRPV